MSLQLEHDSVATDLEMIPEQRKRKRSSFFNAFKSLNNTGTDTTEDAENRSQLGNVIEDDNFEKEYKEILEKENREWDNLRFAMKSKYFDAVEKSKQPQEKLARFSTPDFLTEEEKEYLLQGKRIYKKLAENLDHVIELQAAAMRGMQRDVDKVMASEDVIKKKLKLEAEKLLEELRKRSKDGGEPFNISDVPQFLQDEILNKT